MPAVQPEQGLRFNTEVLPVHELTPEQVIAIYGIQKAAWEDALKPANAAHTTETIGTPEVFTQRLRDPQILVGDINQPKQHYGSWRRTEEGPRGGLHVALASIETEDGKKEYIGYGSSRLNASWRFGNKLLAFMERWGKIATVHKNHLEISGIFVAPKFQGQHVGTTLLTRLLETNDPTRRLNGVRSVTGYQPDEKIFKEDKIPPTRKWATELGMDIKDQHKKVLRFGEWMWETRFSTKSLKWLGSQAVTASGLRRKLKKYTQSKDNNQ